MGMGLHFCGLRPQRSSAIIQVTSSEAVFAFQLFLSGKFRKQFCVFLKAPELNLYASRPLNLRDIPSVIYRCLEAPEIIFPSKMPSLAFWWQFVLFVNIRTQ